MRRRLATMFLLALAWMLAPARADPFTDHLDTLRAAVQQAHDALVDPLSPAQAKEKALLARVLAALDRDAPSLAADLKTIGRVAKLLGKVGSPEDGLDELLAAGLRGLRGDVRTAVDVIAARLAALPESKLRDKALRRVEKIRDALERATAEVEFRVVLRELGRSLAGLPAIERLVARAEASVPKPTCGNDAVGTVSADVDGLSVVFDEEVYAEVVLDGETREVVRVLVFASRDTGEDLATVTVDLKFGWMANDRLPYAGPDTYELDTYGADGPVGKRIATFNGFRYSSGGSFTIESLDLDARALSGSFQFLAEDQFGQLPPATLSAGRVDLACVRVIELPVSSEKQPKR